MAASKRSSSFTYAHFSVPPAMPTALAPATFASWPTSDPTGPLAPATTTVSPGAGLPDDAQAAVCSEPGHPDYAEPRRDRRDGRIELAQVRAIRQGVGAPSRLGKHDVPFRVARMLRRDHRRNGFALHDTT